MRVNHFIKIIGTYICCGYNHYTPQKVNLKICLFEATLRNAELFMNDFIIAVENLLDSCGFSELYVT